jgi:hypothetical protein
VSPGTERGRASERWRRICRSISPFRNPGVGPSPNTVPHRPLRGLSNRRWGAIHIEMAHARPLAGHSSACDTRDGSPVDTPNHASPYGKGLAAISPSLSLGLPARQVPGSVLTFSKIRG